MSKEAEKYKIWDSKVNKAWEKWKKSAPCEMQESLKNITGHQSCFAKSFADHYAYQQTKDLREDLNQTANKYQELDAELFNERQKNNRLRQENERLKERLEKAEDNIFNRLNS